MFDDDKQPLKCKWHLLFLASSAIIVLFIAPTLIFLYFIFFPESEHCWTSDWKDIATPKPTFRPDDIEKDMAPLYALWTHLGLATNIILSLSYIYALRVPIKRTDLTTLGQISFVRKIIFFTVFIMITFITLSVSMRWEHKFEVCSGDLIPTDYYS